MIIGVPKTLDAKNVAKEVDDFATKYRLSEDEKKELTFIMNTFCKYYNKMSDAEQMFEQTAILDSFEGVLETITGTFNGTGTKTRADIFWRQIPCVMKMLADSEDAKAVSKKSKSSKTVTPASKKVSTNKPSSSGSCGGSSSSSSSGSCGGINNYYHSYYSSYGGCGGGGGISGGHC